MSTLKVDTSARKFFSEFLFLDFSIEKKTNDRAFYSLIRFVFI